MSRYKLRKILENLKPSSKIMIFHDTDMDGIGAASLASRYFLLQNISSIDYWYLKKGHRRIDKELIKKINKENYDLLLILDIAGDEFEKDLEKINSSIVIIDHHILFNDYESNNKIAVIKPQLITFREDPSKYPTAKLTYDLLKELDKRLYKYEWIAALGIVGDAAISAWEYFLKKFDMRKLFKAEELISFAVAYNIDNVKSVVTDLSYNVESLDEIIEKYKEYEHLKKELEKLERRCLENKEETPTYLMCKVKSEYEIKSQLANKLSEKHPNKTIILIYDKGDEYYYISLRNQSFKVNLGKILKEISEEMPGKVQGGGHIPAAGAVVLKKDLKEFLEKLKKKIN